MIKVMPYEGSAFPGGVTAFVPPLDGPGTGQESRHTHLNSKAGMTKETKMEDGARPLLGSRDK